MYMPKSKSKPPPTNPVRSSEWWKYSKGADPWKEVALHDFDPEIQAARIQQKIAEENLIAASRELDEIMEETERAKRISAPAPPPVPKGSTPEPKSSQRYVPSKSPPDYVPSPPPINELQLPKARGRKLKYDHKKIKQAEEIKAIITSVRKSIEEDRKNQDIWNKTKYKARKGNVKAIINVLRKNVSRTLFGKGGKSIRRSRKQRK